MRCARAVVSLLVTVAVVAASTLPTQAYQEVAVPDGGTIEGQVVFRDASPPMKKIIPTRNPEVCGGIREEPQIVLAPDNGVRDAVVYLQAIETGKAWEKRAQPAMLENVQCTFAPYVQVLPKGSVLELVNTDPVLHTVHGFLDKHSVFNHGLPAQGQRVKRHLEKPGLIRVDCDSHGWMRAWVYVADNPYYAITVNDGTFTITDVPPGDYTLVAWQEYTGVVEIPVTIRAKNMVHVTVELKKK